MSEKLTPDDLDYNDGLGDMLQDKKPPVNTMRFIWMTVILLLVAIFSFGVSFYLGKKILTRTLGQSGNKPSFKTDLQTTITTIKTENERILHKISQETSPSASSTVVVVKSTTPIAISTPNTPVAVPTPTLTPSPTPVKAPATPVVAPAIKKIHPGVHTPRAVPAKPKKRYVAHAAAQTPLPRPENGTYAIVVGAFSTEANASALANDLRTKYAAVEITNTQSQGKPFYRAQVGRYTSLSEAITASRQLKAAGYPCFLTLLSE